MFIYMSKKIAIPKNTGVSCIAWNQTSGYIAVGGDEGMLKVLKLESGGGGNLSMNLSLEGHSGQLQVATWNEMHQKLTTSDQHGVIIVWMLYKGSWYEEMINNRNKSTVRGMAWSSDGQKICIAYEDGAVIVGSVDGSRVWGKDLKGIGLSAAQWSPDNTLLLFALSTGELNLYDNQGNFAMPVNVQCSSLPMDVVGLDWYAGQVPADRPVLAVCYRNGRIQLMKGYIDDDVVILDTGLETVSCRWNHNGNVIAVAGIGKEDANVVQFFSPYGEHLRTLKVPAGSMRAISWEGRSLRVAIAVDSFIYFANVKPDHKRAFFGSTLVFCSGPDSVTFWDTSTHQTWVNHIPGVVDICGIDEYCVIATQHALVVSNQQGIQCDGKVTSIGVLFVAMNTKGTIVAASKNTFLVWKFATPMRPATPEQVFYTDGSIYVGEKNSAQDPICCIACSDTILLIGLESGAIVSFSMLNMKKLSSYSMPTKPYKMALNSNSSKFYVIDSTGAFFILDTEMASNLGVGQPLKRDVWGAIWAMDNPQLISVAEKARLYILRGTEPEEPLTAQGYLCRFQDLEITSILLDDLVDKFNNDFIVRVEVKSLRDTRQLLDKVGLKEAESFIQDNPHPKLWQLLAEAALRKCEEAGALETAEASYVRRSDYAGVRFVRRLAALHTPALRKADVLAFFKEFDAAEKIYLEEDRRDLAISMRRRLGHWFKVVELLKMSANTSDNQIMEAYNNIGDHYIDRQNWINAIEYYNMANNTDGLTKCYIAIEDNESLANLQNKSPRKHVLKDTSSKTSILSNFGLNGGNDQLTSGNKLNFKDINKQDTPSISNIIQLKEAGRFQHAAMEAYQLAKLEASKKQSPTKIKKLYVLAGIFYSQTSLEGSSNRDAIQSYRCAAAQHWLGLAASLTLARPFRADAAMRAATRLQQFINYLNKEQIPEAWSIVAMIAAEARAFATCSKAFVKLEALPNGEVYSDLAVELFLKYSPKDPKGTKNECPSCQMSLSDWMTTCPDCGMEFPGCSITGRPLYDKNTVWICKMCHQATGQQELVLRHSCPICHASIS